MQKIKDLLHEHQFIISKSAIVIVVSLLGNVFAYAFQIIAGNYLTVEKYGQLTSLFSLSGIIPLAVGLFTAAIPKIVAEIKDLDYPHRISKLFYTLFYFHTAITITTLFVMLALTKNIGNYLNISDTILIQLFSTAVAAGILISFIAPFLQGLMRFKAYSVATFLGSFTKLLVILAVVYLGYNIRGIFLGLTISTIIVGLLSFWAIRKNLTKTKTALDKSDFKTLVKYSAASALGFLGLNLIQNIDIIEVKHLFDEVSAGIYGSTTITGKIIFYAASPVAIVMLPICAEKFKKGENFIKPFLTTLAVALSISASGALIYALFPSFVINTLFGENYIPAIQYLPSYALYTLVYTLMYFICLFLISISKFKLSTLPIFAAIIQYIGINLFAKNIHDVIFISTLSTALVTIPLIFYVYRLSKK